MWFFPAVHIQPPASQTGIPNPATSSFPNMASCDPARVEAALLFNPSEEGEAAAAEICRSAINESVPRIRMCPGPFEQAETHTGFAPVTVNTVEYVNVSDRLR